MVNNYLFFSWIYRVYQELKVNFYLLFVADEKYGMIS